MTKTKKILSIVLIAMLSLSIAGTSHASVSTITSDHAITAKQFRSITLGDTRAETQHALGTRPYVISYGRDANGHKVQDRWYRTTWGSRTHVRVTFVKFDKGLPYITAQRQLCVLSQHNWACS